MPSLAVSASEASVAMNERTESFIEAESADHVWERRSPRPEDDQLLAHTWTWLNGLPRGVRPVQLPADFPRIANDLSRLWAETAALERYFDEKEFSPRNDRRGFPALIKEELMAIHLYALRHRPVACG